MAINPWIQQNVPAPSWPRARMNALAVEQAQQENALRPVEAANRNALIGAQIDNLTSEARYRTDKLAQEQAAGKEKADREWITAAIQHGRLNPALIPQIIADGKNRHVLADSFPETVTPQDLEGLAVRFGVPPDKPESPGQLYSVFGDNGQPMYANAQDALGRTPYERPRDNSADYRPQLVDVTLPDGRVQKQWLRPGQTAGSPVGAPVTPKGRSLTPVAIEKLSELGGTATAFDRLTGTFSDDFGGYVSESLGDAANLYKRTLGDDTNGQAQWWQDYQNQKNIIRNKLFGSALTATEKAEFDKAQITPAMSPTAIRANLQRQREAAAKAALKLAKGFSAGGYSQEQIEDALGISLTELEQMGAGPRAAAPRGGRGNAASGMSDAELLNSLGLGGK